MYSFSVLIFPFSNLVLIFYFQLILCWHKFSYLLFFFLHFSIINSTQTSSFFFFYKNATVFIFNEYENGKKVYSFFIFKITFLEIENENWVQITKLNQFFNGESHWKLKMKTKYTVFFPTCFLLYLKSLKRVALEKLHSFIWNLKENILKWCSSKNLDFPRRINIMGQIEDANKLHHLFESTLAQ